MLGLLFVLGILLRMAYFLSPRSLWGDEWASLITANGSTWDAIRLNAIDTHPPLYYLLLHGAIRLLGFYEPVFRGVSLLMGFAALPAVYFCAKKLWGEKTARWTLATVALSPYAVHLSSEIRNHGMALTTCLWSTFFFLKYLESEKRVWGLAYVLGAVASVYTTHFAWFWFLALSCLGRNKSIGKIQFVVFTLSLPLIPLLYFHLLQGEELVFWDRFDHYGTFTLLKKIMGVFWHTTVGHAFQVDWSQQVKYLAAHALPFQIAAAYFVSLFISALFALKKYRETAASFAFVMAAFVLPLLIIAVLNPARLNARYFAFSAIFFIMFLTWALTQLKSRVFRFGIATLAIFTALHGNWVMIRLSMDPVQREDFKSEVLFVLSHAQSTDAICTDNGLCRYYRGKLGVPNQAEWIEQKDLTLEKINRYERIWFLDGEAVPKESTSELKNHMDKLGFVLKLEALPFGDPQCFAILNIFEKKSV